MLMGGAILVERRNHLEAKYSCGDMPLSLHGCFWRSNCAGFGTRRDVGEARLLNLLKILKILEILKILKFL